MLEALKYPESIVIRSDNGSQFIAKSVREMQTEMLEFQKARLKKLSESKKDLNNQEKEELAFYNEKLNFK
jgi:transposase InsO family protein